MREGGHEATFPQMTWAYALALHQLLEVDLLKSQERKSQHKGQACIYPLMMAIFLHKNIL